MVFPVVLYRCESWTVKKAERRRTDAFKLWCWRRLLRAPWIARIPNKSILKENQSWMFIGRTDVEAETPIFWPPDAKNCLIRKDPVSGKVKAGGEGDDRGWDGWMASPTRWTWVWANSGNWWWTRKPGVLQTIGLQRVRHDWATKLTELIKAPASNFRRSKIKLLVLHFCFLYLMWKCPLWPPERKFTGRRNPGNIFSPAMLTHYNAPIPSVNSLDDYIF